MTPFAQGVILFYFISGSPFLPEMVFHLITTTTPLPRMYLFFVMPSPPPKKNALSPNLHSFPFSGIVQPRQPSLLKVWYGEAGGDMNMKGTETYPLDPSEEGSFLSLLDRKWGRR